MWFDYSFWILWFGVDVVKIHCDSFGKPYFRYVIQLENVQNIPLMLYCVFISTSERSYVHANITAPLLPTTLKIGHNVYSIRVLTYILWKSFGGAWSISTFMYVENILKNRSLSSSANISCTCISMDLIYTSIQTVITFIVVGNHHGALFTQRLVEH